jgi:Family of unknown function (DUF5829)
MGRFCHLRTVYILSIEEHRENYMDTNPKGLQMEAHQTFPTPPHFDHVFVTVDEDTFNAIQACEFLSSSTFGRYVVRESESSLIGRYRPIRIFGRSTLVEVFLNKFGDGEFESVNAGLVLSFDYPGEALAARQRLSSNDIAYRGEVIRRTFPGEADPIPWYLSTRPDMGAGSSLALFLSEIDTDYWARIGAPLGSDGRQDPAAHYEAALRRPHGPEYLMRDIVEVSYRLRPARTARVVSVLTAVGYEAHKDGSVVLLSGPDSDIRLHSDESAPEGLLGVKIKLTNATSPSVRRFDFGSTSSLTLPANEDGDRFAVWSFVPKSRSA